jgi:hypothetical protein
VTGVLNVHSHCHFLVTVAAVNPEANTDKQRNANAPLQLRTAARWMRRNHACWCQLLGGARGLITARLVLHGCMRVSGLEVPNNYYKNSSVQVNGLARPG